DGRCGGVWIAVDLLQVRQGIVRGLDHAVEPIDLRFKLFDLCRLQAEKVGSTSESWIVRHARKISDRAPNVSDHAGQVGRHYAARAALIRCTVPTPTPTFLAMA